jgi:hypothetical protein
MQYVKSCVEEDNVIKMSRSKSLFIVRQGFPPLISEQADLYDERIAEIEVAHHSETNRKDR